MNTNQPRPRNEQLSDKFYWHGYIPFYESFFGDRDFKHIAEFGIFKGDSIRWLLQRFPNSQIFGADILPLQPAWPVDEHFHFQQLDQSSRDQIRDFLSRKSFDLIIEDGSHIPKHQVNCLVEGMRLLQNGGIYILEDVQTSLPHHPIHYRKGWLGPRKVDVPGNALSVLLAIDHYQRIGRPMTTEMAVAVAAGSLMTPDEVWELAGAIASIHLYRRTHLPDHCHACGSTDFNFSDYRCTCGQPIFADTDSMSFVILKR